MKLRTKLRSVEYLVMIVVCFWLTDAFALCRPTPQASAIGVAFSASEPAQVDSSQPYQLDADLSELSVSGDQWQITHQYHQLGYDRDNSSTPLPNGHLHALALSFSNERKHSVSKSINWAVVPTLTVSSNQLRHSHSLNSSAFRLDAHLIWQKPVDNKYSYYLGGCLSGLTGDYELTPVLAMQYKFKKVELVVGYPNSQLDIHFLSSASFFTGWSLQGQQWQVLDKDLQNRGDLNYSAEEIRLGIKMKLSRQHFLEVYWLNAINRSMEYLDRNNNSVDVDINDANGWMIRYSYLM